MKTITNQLPHVGDVQSLPNTYPFPCVFLDIETTGFHRAFCQVMLIGILTFNDPYWERIQWFSESPEDEIQLLEALLAYLKAPSVLVTFNGLRFDLPFLAARLAHHHLFPSPEDALQHLNKTSLHIDLLPIAKKLPHPLENYRLKTIERFLNIHRSDTISGAESVQLYRQYLKTPTQNLLKAILLHNADDIDNMLPLWRIFDYLSPTDQMLLRPHYTSPDILWLAHLDEHLTVEGLCLSNRHLFHSFGAHKITLANHHFHLQLHLSSITHQSDLLKVVRYPDFPEYLRTLPPETWLVLANEIPDAQNLAKIISHLLNITEM